jgi:hypothetical protein
MPDDTCEKLLEEYEALRRRLEEMDFSSPDYDVDEDVDGVRQSDIERLRDLEDRLETECDVELPDEQESDLDLPEYAAESPSEPRNYEKES